MRYAKKVCKEIRYAKKDASKRGMQKKEVCNNKQGMQKRYARERYAKTTQPQPNP
jgi:hypothetical protein